MIGESSAARSWQPAAPTVSAVPTVSTGPTAPSAGSRWLVRHTIRPDAPVRVFCLPFAGGSATAFRGWSADAPRLEIVSVELPGHGRRLAEPLIRTLPTLVRELATAITPWLHDKSFALFGHSMGGLLAFELARELRRRRLPAPSHLFVSSTAPPSPGPAGRPLHLFTDDQLVAELRRLGGTPLAVLQEPELLALLLPVLRADLTVCHTHHHRVEPPLACPITVIGGRSDLTVPWQELLGWAAHTSGPFERIVLPGGHFYLDSQQATMISRLSAALVGSRHSRSRLVPARYQ